MAKRRGRRKKYTIGRILAMSSKEVSKLSDKDLRSVVTIMNSAANKRLKRVYASGLESGAVERQLEKGKFSVKGITTRAGLENAYIDVRNFLSKETTTVSGIHKSQRKMFRKLAQKVNKEMIKGEKIRTSLPTMSDEKLSDLTDLVWSQVDKLAEDKSRGIIRKSMERYKIAERAYELATRSESPVKTKDELFEYLVDFYNKNYKSTLQKKSNKKKSRKAADIEAIYNNYE